MEEWNLGDQKENLESKIFMTKIFSHKNISEKNMSKKICPKKYFCQKKIHQKYYHMQSPQAAMPRKLRLRWGQRSLAARRA